MPFVCLLDIRVISRFIMVITHLKVCGLQGKETHYRLKQGTLQWVGTEWYTSTVGTVQVLQVLDKDYPWFEGGSVAEWLACTQAQPVHTNCASVHQAAKLVAALAESNGSLPPGLRLTSRAGWLPSTGISSGTLRSVIEYFTRDSDSYRSTCSDLSIKESHRQYVVLHPLFPCFDMHSLSPLLQCGTACHQLLHSLPALNFWWQLDIFHLSSFNWL